MLHSLYGLVAAHWFVAVFGGSCLALITSLGKTDLVALHFCWFLMCVLLLIIYLLFL